jgi:mannose-6-phosphate isomerase-like protein (cupin superfamily)
LTQLRGFRENRRRMAESRGFVIDQAAVPLERAEDDTVARQVAIDASSGCERLELQLLHIAPGRSRERVNPEHEEVMYVASGSGAVEVEGGRHVLAPDTGVYVAAGRRYVVDNPGPDDLRLVSVLAPREVGNGGEKRVVVRYEDQPVLPASPNREFRFLVNEDAGCRDVTQFVGIIPPGRAPMHSHIYDEVVYVVEGEGALHFEDSSTPIAAGTCIHLPPLLLHCLENTGPRPMRVLGVFHPSGSPASRAVEAKE